MMTRLKTANKMKKTKRVKKVRKRYGLSKGDSFLALFYSYCLMVEKIRDNEHDYELSELRTAFNQYIIRKYGRTFYDEYCVFHILNKDNKLLIKALKKKKTLFLNRDVLNLLPEKNTSECNLESSKDEQNEKPGQSQSVYVQTMITEFEGKNKKIPSTNMKEHHPIQSVVQVNPYVDLTPGRIYSNLPARDIDYLQPSFSNRSFRITMKRLMDGSEFVVYHQGKDANEAMALANRHSFDSARIIRVEEEKTTKIS